MDLAKTSNDMANLVGDYLLSHPDFLNDHPEILTNLNLTHPTGKNVSSLIERQVDRLREQNRFQQCQIDFLHQAIESEQHITISTLSTTNEIINADSIKELYDQVFRCCKDHHLVSDLNLFLFTDTAISFRQRHIYIDNEDCRLKRMFAELFNRNKSLCDSLQEEYIHMLFGKQNEIESTLLIPFSNSSHSLLLAIGSRQRNAYKQGFELKLLEYLMTVFVQRLNRLI